MRKCLNMIKSSTEEGGSWYGDTITIGGTGMTDFNGN